MEARSFDRILLKPVILISVLVIALTFLSHLSGRSESGWTRIQYLLWVFDLRSKGNLAMWFEVMLFALNGLIFLSLGFQFRSLRAGNGHLGWLLILIALVLLFLSADEMLAIHIGVGKRLDMLLKTVSYSPFDGVGVTWLLVYIPLGMVVFFLSLYLFANLVMLIPASLGIRNRIVILLCLSGVSVACVVALELIEKLSGAFRSGGSVIACFEESFEIVALILLFAAGIYIREGISQRSRVAEPGKP